MQVLRVLDLLFRAKPRMLIIPGMVFFASSVMSVGTVAQPHSPPIPAARPSLDDAPPIPVARPSLDEERRADRQDQEIHHHHHGAGHSDTEQTAGVDHSAHVHNHNPQKQVRRVGDIDELFVVGVNTKTIDLKSILTPGTIIHFWASWCGPCREEFPELEQFYLEHIQNGETASDFRLITISNDNAVADAEKFIKALGITFPVFWDVDQTTNLAMLGRRSLPSTVMVGGDGRFHRLALGKLEWGFPGLPRIIQATAELRPQVADVSEDGPTISE